MTVAPPLVMAGSQVLPTVLAAASRGTSSSKLLAKQSLSRHGTARGNDESKGNAESKNAASGTFSNGAAAQSWQPTEASNSAAQKLQAQQYCMTSAG